jgi:hypothetical protein
MMSVLFGWSVTDVGNFINLCAQLKEAFGQGRGGEMFAIDKLRNHVRTFERQMLQLRQVLGTDEQYLSVDTSFVYSTLFHCISYVCDQPAKRSLMGSASFVAYRREEMEKLSADLDSIRQALTL